MQLVLNTFGTSLVKENGLFKVVHIDGVQLIMPTKIKSIMISKGAKISSDAALLAIENEIDVLFMDGIGKPAGRLWSIKFGSITTIRRKQLDFIYSPRAVDWIKEIITRKIDNQTALMLSMQESEGETSKQIDKAVNKLNEYKKKLNAQKAEIITDIAPTLRGWEGAASKAYFDVLSVLVPPDYRFKGRSQHPATDVFNCLLNYGYGILYGKIEGAMIKAGIDPYTGVFHREDYNRPVLVFDVIEIFRVWIDYVVLTLCQQKAVDDDCYSIRKDGSYWLESMGKRILIQSVNDYLNEVIMLNGLERSRETHIELYASKLASFFMELKTNNQK